MKGLPFLILIAVILSCTVPHLEREKTNSPDSAPNLPKIHPNLSKFTNPTGSTYVYQNDFMLEQPIIVNGKPVGGQHQIEIRNGGGYDGPDKKCIESRLSLSLIVEHLKPTESGWQLAKNSSISFLVDGNEYKPVITSQVGPIKTGSNYSDTFEAVSAQPTCEMIQKLASTSGGSAQIRVGDAIIELSSNDRATFHEFAEAVGIP
jgi:hypothetical protein